MFEYLLPGRCGCGSTGQISGAGWSKNEWHVAALSSVPMLVTIAELDIHHPDYKLCRSWKYWDFTSIWRYGYQYLEGQLLVVWMNPFSYQVNDFLELLADSPVQLEQQNRKRFSNLKQGECMRWLAKPKHVIAGNSKARVDKVPPKMMDYFGWCTWDAFYSTISAEGDTLLTFPLVDLENLPYVGCKLEFGDAFFQYSAADN